MARSHRGRCRPDLELLDADTWEAPARLTSDDCLLQTGADRHWNGADPDDAEDDR